MKFGRSLLLSMVVVTCAPSLLQATEGADTLKPTTNVPTPAPAPVEAQDAFNPVLPAQAEPLAMAHDAALAPLPEPPVDKVLFDAALLDAGVMLKPPHAPTASAEGMACIRYLKKGGGKTLPVIGATIGTALLGAGTIAGAVLTAPTGVGPLLFGVYGSMITVFSSSGALALSHRHEQDRALGKMIAAAYQFRELKATSTEVRIKASKKLIWFRDNHIVTYYPDTRLNVETLADSLISLNESGHFCPAKVFKARGVSLPEWVGSLRGPVTSEATLSHLVDNRGQERVAAFRNYFAECERAKEERARGDYEAMINPSK